MLSPIDSGNGIGHSNAASSSIDINGTPGVYSIRTQSSNVKGKLK